MNKRKKLKAFSLNELLVVMVIIGILTSVAIPMFGGLSAKAMRTEAQAQLSHLKGLQEIYREANFKFTTDFKALGFELPLTEEEGGTRAYDYEVIEATSTTYILQATALNDYDGDGVFEVLTQDRQGKMKFEVED